MDKIKQILELMQKRDAAQNIVLQYNSELTSLMMKMVNSQVPYSVTGFKVPIDYPGTWTDKCIYILKEAQGEKLTAQEVIERLKKYHVGFFGHPAIEQTLHGLRKFPKDGFRSEMIKGRRVFWIDDVINEPNSLQEDRAIRTILKKIELPAPFEKKALVLVELNTGAQAMRVFNLNGDLIEMPGEVKPFLREINDTLQLGVHLTHPNNGKALTTVELGRNILEALSKQK